MPPPQWWSNRMLLATTRQMKATTPMAMSECRRSSASPARWARSAFAAIDSVSPSSGSSSQAAP